MPGPVGWLRARAGVRVVSALSAAVVVALSLLVAGAALVFLLEHFMRGQVQSTALERADLIVQRVSGNYEQVANENARNAIDILATPDDLAQVLVAYGDPDDRNVVVEASTDAVGRDAPISDLFPDDDKTVVVPETTIRKADGSTVESVLVAVGTDSASRDVVVLLAMPLTTVEQTTHTLLFYLACGVPLLMLVVAGTTYFFAGRALRPVEAIRRQVSAMTEKELAQRVPVPKAHDEVGRLAETMNGMLARLQDAQGVQRRFVADASHELRSPLATIATGLELMHNGAADASTIPALRGETDRLRGLVDGLILLARADERGLQPRREEVDLDEVAESERGRPADGAVVAEVRAQPVRVIGDRGQLARVVRNLVDNARRHARSRVLVVVRREGEDAVLEVSDDGPGVPPADRARVFERFVRLDDARARVDGGSGLGLAIVTEVVAAHGGRVELTDAPGGGALFRVRLPAVQAPEPSADPIPTTGTPRGGDEPVPRERPDLAATLPAPRPAPAPRLAPGQRRPPGAEPRPVPPPGRDGQWRPGLAQQAVAGPVPSPAPGRHPAVEPPPLPLPPRPAGFPIPSAPVRDAEARRDPETKPYGMPAASQRPRPQRPVVTPPPQRPVVTPPPQRG